MRFVGAGAEEEGPESEGYKGQAESVAEEIAWGGWGQLLEGGAVDGMGYGRSLTGTRSISAWGNWMARLSSENMRWKGSRSFLDWL